MNMLGSTAVLNHNLRKYKTIQVTVEIVSLAVFFARCEAQKDELLNLFGNTICLFMTKNYTINKHVMTSIINYK